MASSRAREEGEAMEVDSDVQRGLAPPPCIVVLPAGPVAPGLCPPSETPRFPTSGPCTGSSGQGHQRLLWGHRAPCSSRCYSSMGSLLYPLLLPPTDTPWVTGPLPQAPSAAASKLLSPASSCCLCTFDCGFSPQARAAPLLHLPRTPWDCWSMEGTFLVLVIMDF